jgi:hypothetical protein
MPTFLSKTASFVFCAFLHLVFVSAVLFAGKGLAHAQTCWVYTDNQQAPAPMKCVQKTNLAASCTCNPSNATGSCQNDCTAVPIPPGSQTIRQLHEEWHNCFGAIGGSNPLAGRGERWYAFHRQFNFDFDVWRKATGYAEIESLEWCPNMVEPIGTAGSGYVPPADVTAAGCNQLSNGTTPAARPAGAVCTRCIAFPHCLFKAGGGPLSCSTAPSSSCQGSGGLTFPYTALEQFKNIDEVAKILDFNFHGIMHVASGQADRTAAQGCDLFGTGNDTGCYNVDTLTPTCAPRDPMFWRLHKAIDDVVRAWQNEKATDVVLVIDRSGSMSEPDVASGLSKLTAALNAAENFGDMMNTARSDGQVNTIGIVSYSDSATSDLAMTNVDTHLLDAGGPFETAKAHVATVGASGCTAIAKGLQNAVDLLCPGNGGTCQGFVPPAGTNSRKAILVLTDGVENVPPCLQTAGAAGGTCGSQCFGPPFDYTKLAQTQLVSVGFGSGADLNGPLLTLLAERQGGIYMQNPNGPGYDLKDFYGKAFGSLTSEFVATDPKGLLPANQAASEPFEYNGCSDSTVTFDSGWNIGVTPGDLTLVVDGPNGDLVRAGDPGVQSSRRGLWHFSRVRLPYHGAASGNWRGQIIRPHRLYVNGFVTDAFASPKEGTVLVRREIHRLCPQGCKRVLYYEQGRLSPQSVYQNALQLEKQAGLVGTVTTVALDPKFTPLLTPNKWDLIVYAQMGKDLRRTYDAPLSRLLCAGQRAIITDTRTKNRGLLFECAGVQFTQAVNWNLIDANGSLVDHALKLVNHGYPVFTYGLTSANIQAVAHVVAAAAPVTVGAVAARVTNGKDEQWFANVLTTSLGRLSPHNRKTNWKTGEEPIAEVRMLPSDVRSGGWDKVDARVEVEYPTVGVGALLAQRGLGQPTVVNKERIDPRAAALAGINIPTAKKIFPLFDDGTHGDLYPGNAFWTAELTGLGKTDGLYKLRYIFDLTAAGCTTHRELAQSFYVDVGVDGKSSRVTPGDVSTLPNGWHKLDVSVSPADISGNSIGPGRNTTVTCAPRDSCRVDPKTVDGGKGIYKIALEVAPQTGSVHLDAFDAGFNVPTACPDCPRLTALKVEPAAVMNYQKAEATITLSAPAPKTPDGGAVVFLASDERTAASVPESIVVPAGKTSVSFPITVYHVHDVPEEVTVSAAYGPQVQTGTLKVSDPDSKNAGTVTPRHRPDD